MFSVVIPVYNKAQYVGTSINSVLSQTLPDFELIIVNDGSTDSSLTVVKSYQDQRIIVISQENLGAGAARNRGVDESSGDWIAFLDADDVWSKDHLEELRILIAEFDDAGIVATRSTEVYTGKFNPSSDPGSHHKRSRVDFFRKSAVITGLLNSSSVAVRRSVFRDVGYFGTFQQGEDTEFWARVCLRFPFASSARRTSYYVRGTGGIMEQRHDRQFSNDRAIATVSDIGPAAAYLVTALETGAVRPEMKDSVITFINSRITLALKASLYNGRVEKLPSISALYQQPLLSKHRFWKALSAFPRPGLQLFYQFRHFLRRLYRASAGKAG